MEDVKVREPIQKRSIEKKERIVKTGFNVICKKGYYNTNTAEIAKEAGVSTGIVYNYFKDKRDILLEGVNEYSNSILFPILELIENKSLTEKYIEENIELLIDKAINISIKNHKSTKAAHRELFALGYLDREVGHYFVSKEMEFTEEVYKLFEKSNYKIKHPKEKIHIVINLIESLCREIVYHRHSDLDNEIMRKETAKLIIACLK